MSFQPDTAPLVAHALFNVGQMVDEYGALKAEAAAIEAKLDAIKKALQATGRDEFREGALFDCTMSISDGRESEGRSRGEIHHRAAPPAQYHGRALVHPGRLQAPAVR